MEQFDRIKQARDQRLHKENEDIRHNDLITQSIQTQETILRAFSSFVDYLDNRVGKTEVVNQLKTIGTPDAMKVVDALNSLHETLKTHENTDLTEVTAIMQAVLDQAKLIPKELPQLKDIVIPEAQDYSNQFEAMIGAVESLEEAVKAQETTVQAPVVNVDAPIVKVDAPDLKPLEKASQKLLDAIKGIVIPAQIQTDITPLLKEQKKTNKLLEEMPIAGGGGGGSVPLPYQDSTGQPTTVQLTVDGKIPVEAGATSTYEGRNDTTTDTNLVYLAKAIPGTATSAAAWQIKRYNKSAGHMSFADDVTTFTKVWDDRTSYTY